jgi:protein subunit release factor A
MVKQDRVTDHRLVENGTLYGVEGLMAAENDGEALGEIIDKLENLQLTLKLGDFISK